MAKSKWRNNFPAKAEKLAEDGYIDIQIAQALGISEATFYNYQAEHIEFLESIKRGKAKTDKRVIESLLKRATGFEYEETTTEMEVDGKTESVTAIKKTKKYVAPDTGAIAFWLKNRQPEHWRDVRQIEGNLGGSVIIVADESTKKLLDGIEKLGTKSPKDRDNESISADD